MQAGLAAGYGNAVQEALSLCQEGEEFFLLHHRLCGAVRQLEVMAVGAAEIAAAQEHRAGHVSREVQQCHFL